LKKKRRTGTRTGPFGAGRGKNLNEPKVRNYVEPTPAAQSPAIPKAGDAAIYPNGTRVTVSACYQGMVYLTHKQDFPIPVEHFKPSGEPRTWNVVGFSSTDDM
jgi:hypothetical protein